MSIIGSTLTLHIWQSCCKLLREHSCKCSRRKLNLRNWDAHATQNDEHDYPQAGGFLGTKEDRKVRSYLHRLCCWFPPFHVQHFSETVTKDGLDCHQMDPNYKCKKKIEVYYIVDWEYGKQFVADGWKMNIEHWSWISMCNIYQITGKRKLKKLQSTKAWNLSIAPSLSMNAGETIASNSLKPMFCIFFYHYCWYIFLPSQ